MRCCICGKPTQHPKMRYCKKCKKEISALPKIDYDLLRAQYIQKEQRKYEEQLLQEKLNRK